MQVQPHPVGSAFASDLYQIEPERVEALGGTAWINPGGYPAEEMVHRELRLALVQRLSLGVFEPPRLPEAATRVMAIADDPEADIDKLAKVIHQDPFLAMRLLRVANSATYRPVDRRIYSLEQAIARLGLRGTRDVVVAAALAQSIYSGPRGELMHGFWRAAVGAAVGFHLVEWATGKNADAAFLAGLLHNVGKPVLVWMLDELIRTRFEGRVRFDDVAPELLHLLHPRIGAIIVGTWDAPQGMVDLVAHHHDRLPPAKQRSAIRKLRLANLLWELWERDPSVAVLDPAYAHHTAFERSGLDERQALAILERYPQRVAGMLAS